MSDFLTLKVNDEKVEVHANRSDIAASLVRGIVGAAPVIGPLISEVIANVIPNQKLDRLVTFIKILEDKVNYLSDDLKQNYASAINFIRDFVEDYEKWTTRKIYSTDQMIKGLMRHYLRLRRWCNSDDEAKREFLDSFGIPFDRFRFADIMARNKTESPG